MKAAWAWKKPCAICKSASKLSNTRARLEQTRLELEEAKQVLEERADAEKTATEALTRRERELAMRSREAIDAAVRDARDAISEIVREVRRERSPQAADAARVAAGQESEGSHRQAARAAGARPQSLARGPGQSRARYGREGQEEASPRSERRAPRSPNQAPLCLQSRANSLDLRGQRADEALAELEAFLDRTALEGADTVFVIHGHGTGALRKVVREYLATSPYVERFRAGGAGEGGDGVSVVSLKG
jgi:DNA mismatch repair protein MutS2